MEKESQSKNNINRREFLKRFHAAMAIAGMPALIGCQANKENTQADTSTSKRKKEGGMTYRTTPTTGDKVSLLGYGCMRWFTLRDKETGIIDQEGVNRLVDYAIEHGVKNVVVLSTDKAAYPVSAMGISKSMMEKVATAKARQLGDNAQTTICCTRYGNVMASRGSVIPLWVDQMEQGKPITITDPKMSRFMMTLNDAVDLVIYAFEHGKNGDLFVQKAPAATLDVLAEALKQTYAKIDPKYGNAKIKVIGTRHGEKLYETLVTREEMARAIDMGDYYRIPCDGRDLNYDKVEGGNPEIDKMDEYHSHNTKRLSVEEMKELLLKLTFIREDLGLQPRAHAKEIRSE